MTVNSVLSTGIEGVRTGIKTTQNAAQDIANLGTPSSNIAAEDKSSASPQDTQNTKGLDTLAKAIVDLKVGEHQVKASSAVIKTADEVLGTLVDVKA